MQEENKNTTDQQFHKTAVMRSFCIKNYNLLVSITYFIMLIYVNNNMPFRVRRVNFGETYLELADSRP